MPTRTRLSVVSSNEASAALKSRTATACLIAKDAVNNLLEFASDKSRMAFLAVKECERELDQFEREIDEQLPIAITRVGERKARELIACLRFTTDLERIGDLVWWIAQRLNDRAELQEADAKVLHEMGEKLALMLEEVHRGFVSGDPQNAQAIIARDKEIDELRRQVFSRHLLRRHREDNPEGVDTLFMVQAMERAGDHATNLAEELIHMYEGRSVRHLPKKIAEA